MRRASVIGPLILIALGVLFLINNFWPSTSIWDLVAQFWPYILIGWGVLRLIEIAIWHFQGKALPMRGMGGGEWTLIVLFSVFAAGTSEVRNHWPGMRFAARGVEVFGESFDYPQQAKSPADAKFSRILIENMRGNCRIVGGDTKDVSITGRKTVRAFKQEEADESNRQSPLEVTVVGDQLVIRSNHDRVTGDRRVSSDLELTVPRNISIEARGRYGDFEVNDLNGGVDVISDNAGVRLQNIGGAVKVDLRRSDIIRAVGVKGPVELKGRGSDVELENIDGLVTITGNYSGEVQLRNLTKALRFDSSSSNVHVEKVPGNLRIALANISGTNLVGPISLNSGTRDIELTDFTQGLEITLNRGDIDLRPGKLPLSKIDVKTQSGNIELSVPPAAKFELKATTQRGEIENDYGAPFSSENSGRGQTLTGSVGSGPAVTLSTNRGSVTLRKTDGTETTSEVAPAAKPTPPRPPAMPKEPLPKAENQ